VEKTPTKRGEAIELTGTEFQIKVWRELMNIPSGETRSYKEVAEAIGHPNSSRAVANACAKNLRPDVVPCHRVIRSDGGLGGYSGEGGVETKLMLLNDEGVF
tara:strand:- start:320 stop:625 length:306 start_codon:yes stop_codon:yes gene_type:complete